ncbi:MAG TPA: alanine--tRNA ligase [Polyangiaceae bacterium]|nr:alanine--tRNA ligase [Polyangiaceae bacterium]
MSTRTAAEIRSAFLSFFARNGHEVVPSSSVVLQNDPTLMFANAGMVQFKDLFTGREKRSYKRATSSQKCIRISGKHNDLEAVGPSPRHHTFFEMLGNFSFGDYFKEEAIVFAWQFVTKELALPKDRLVMSYFKGEQGIPEDTFARDLWKKLTGFGDAQVRGLGMADNFWAMGDTGPCGPCSEIYFWNGNGVDTSKFGEEQTPEGVGYCEIWNLVFMQFERSLQSGVAKLQPLPAPSIDTGGGLERMCLAVQGKLSTYDTDLLRSLVEGAAQISGKKYGGSMSPDDVSMRVIADHARTTAIMVGDGVMPDRTGREYVLRRVMRRAVRHGHRLGIQKPFLHQVCATVVELMGQQYPELRERQDLIQSVAEAEEVRFRQTIERGLSLLEDRFDVLKSKSQTTLSGDDAFDLYSTHGFPLDLTQVICAERGFSVDEDGYKRRMEIEKENSQFAGADQAVEGVYREALAKLPEGGVRFSGYEKTRDSSEIVAIVKAGALSDVATAGDEVELVTRETPFYGAAGGQVGDTGVINAGTAKLTVEDSQRPISGLIVHRGKVTAGSLKVGQSAELLVDEARRDRIRRNHSATHLLHLALRKVLGAHAQQKGSLVGPDRLRFDFTHTKPLTPQEIRQIEDLVNERTLANHPVSTDVLDMVEARKRGAVMIFEEKYGDVVRMLTMGDSVELCGGTHARATGDIGMFKIVSEVGIAAGVRRIQAVTGDGALQHLRELEDALNRAAQAAKANPALLVDRIEKFWASEKALEKQVAELQRKLMSGGGGFEALLGKARDVAGVKVLGVRTDVTDRAQLRELAEQLRDKLGESIVLVASEHEGKAQLVLTVAKPLLGRFKAGELIRGVAEIVGGSGGGRPDMAQAGGTEPAKLDEAIEALYKDVGGSG